MARLVTRRTALSLLSAIPIVGPVDAQVRPAPLRRVFPGSNHALILEPDGAMKGWGYLPVGLVNRSGELGLGHNNPVPPDTLPRAGNFPPRSRRMVRS